MIPQEYPFVFSVIMAVYNAERYLDKAIESLIKQNFGFERIQLILVDDGSSDNSGAICDTYHEKYPDNIIVLHKENGGVASARNAGLEYATGRFLNFMDSDDAMGDNVFSLVYRFFTKYENDIDVVTIPIRFFDAQRGEHWQNYKFKKGTRIVSLFEEHQTTDMSVAASFFKHQDKDKLFFDSALVCGEDTKVILTVLSEKMKIGLVDKCCYYYRRHTEGGSLVNTTAQKKGWYTDYFTNLVEWAFDYYKKRFGHIPLFVQYTIAADLQWRIKDPIDTSCLTREEYNLYKKYFFSALPNISDSIIMQQRRIQIEHKCFLLEKKYGHKPDLSASTDDILVHFGDTAVCLLSKNYTHINFLRFENNTLIIEGFTKLLGIDENEPVKLFLKINGNLQPCELVEREDISDYRFDELMCRGVAFKATIPLHESTPYLSIQFVTLIRNSYVTKKVIRFGKFSPIAQTYKSAYYYNEGWCVFFIGATLHVNRCNTQELIKREIKYLIELKNSTKIRDRKALLVRLCYHLLRFLYKNKRIWLISDRVKEAGDNGEAFFRYLCAHPQKGLRAYFAISPQSKDYDNLKKIGNVIPFGGHKYKLLSLLAENIISAHGEDYIFNPFGPNREPYRDLLCRHHNIFLQHGIIKDDLSSWCGRYSKNFDIFLTSTKPEYDSIVNGNYYYSNKEICLTGLPRYDFLYHNEKNIITIMPTWRQYLADNRVLPSGRSPFKSGVENSTYYQMYKNLLNCKMLFDAAVQAGYTICFISHPRMEWTPDFMPVDERLIFLPQETLFKKIFAESNLLVTDFSSTAFDFAYLRKPVLYYQADYDEFFAGTQIRQKGYFDYERDGFGEVEYDADSMAKRIIEYITNGCHLKKMYRERIESTFAFNDHNNCQRVINAILNLRKQEI